MLKFDSEKHQYTFNGEVVASVTQILKAGGIIDDRWYTEESRARGTAVHETAFLYLQNDLDFESIHPIVKPYFDAFLKFMADTKFKPMIQLCEVPQYNPFSNYAGTPDMVGILNGRPALVDLKTGDAKQSARYQTAAYADMPAIKVYSPDRFDLRLFPDGKYKLNAHRDSSDLNTFLSCLNVARAKGYA